MDGHGFCLGEGEEAQVSVSPVHGEEMFVVSGRLLTASTCFANFPKLFSRFRLCIRGVLYHRGAEALAASMDLRI